MELAKYSLEEELSYSKNSEDIQKFRIYLKHVAMGLQYLHDNNIVHRDIKPQNVLIFENTGTQVAKLGDFGMSRQMSKSEGTISFGHGTKIWMAPEALSALDDEEEFLNTKAMDIFSFGLVFYYSLYDQRHPFQMKEKLLVNIKDANVIPDDGEMNYFANGSPVAWHLAMWMMQTDPAKRPTIKQCRAHPYFWENPEEKTVQFFNDVLDTASVWAYLGEGECSSDDSFPKHIRTVHHCVDYAVAFFYRTKMRNSRNSVQVERPWNWQMDIEESLLKSKCDDKRGENYNGYSVFHLLKFVRDNSQNSDDFADGVIENLFCEEGSCNVFSREKYFRYFIEMYPQLVFLFFFVLARIAPEHEHLETLKEKYFRDFSGCHEDWNLGVITECIEKFYKRMSMLQR